MIDLGVPSSGYTASYAYNLNNLDQVVGSTQASSAGNQCFLWANNDWTIWKAPSYGTSYFSCYAYDINDLGQVVGIVYDTPGGTAYLRDQYGNMTNLGDLPGGSSTSIAYGISPNGRITGFGSSSTGSEAYFMPYPSYGMIPLGYLPSLPGGILNSNGNDVSDYNGGTVVGSSSSPNGTQAFIWINGQGMSPLGDLAGGSFYSIAYGTNATEDVVGVSNGPLGGEAFLWNKEDGMVSLNALLDASGTGWFLQNARAINNKRQIVGTGISPAGKTEAFLLTPITPPTLAVVPATLNFSATQGSVTPDYEYLFIGNDGAGGLDFTVTADVTWITRINPTGGAWGSGYYSTVTLYADPGNLPPGVYTGNVTVASTTAVNSPVIIPVTFTVLAGPMLGFSPSEFTFSATQGGPNPPNQTLNIWNAGIGTLNWVLSSYPSWITISPTAGTNTGAAQVAVDIAGLDVGTYMGQVGISVGSVTYILRATLIVNPPSAGIGFSPTSFTFNTVQGALPPPAQTLSIYNAGGGIMNWSVSADPLFIKISPTGGNGSGEISVSVDGTGMTAGSHAGSITITSSEAANSPQTIPVTLIIKAPFTLLDPDGGEVLTYRSSFRILWETLLSLGAAKTELSYSTDSGGTWKVIKTLTGNPGYYDWVVPALKKPSSTCRIKVVLKTAKGAILAQDASNGNFAIQP